MISRVIISILLSCSIMLCNAQCPGAINSFPYKEGFELNDGGWISGGTGDDWAWGTPTKPVINAAATGLKCWVVGGLTPGPYTDGEASWLQSPCFDFTNLTYPYIEFKVFWEMERQFDGASFQYSTDNGATWSNVGAVADAKDCLDSNWFNYGPINYLSSLTSVRDGWSGNIQSTNGSCKGGNGSNGWVKARHVMPYLAGQSSVIFRFIFGAGTICNNYDGFAVDDIMIDNAPPNSADFTYTCLTNTKVNFTNSSSLCPSMASWDFGDPTSGANNTATGNTPVHIFSGPGTYTVQLNVSGPGNAPSSVSRQLTVLSVSVTQLAFADCQTNTGGSLIGQVTGTTAPLNYSWNTSPVQTTSIATNLGQGNYVFTVSGTDICTATGIGAVEVDPACTGIYFPSAFTPNNNGKNDAFGPLGNIGSLTNYSLRIYNRWGELIFYSKNPFEKWNGMVRGVATQTGLFVWYSEFELLGKAPEKRKGIITLIR